MKSLRLRNGEPKGSAFTNCDLQISETILPSYQPQPAPTSLRNLMLFLLSLFLTMERLVPKRLLASFFLLLSRISLCNKNPQLYSSNPPSRAAEMAFPFGYLAGLLDSSSHSAISSALPSTNRQNPSTGLFFTYGLQLNHL